MPSPISPIVGPGGTVQYFTNGFDTETEGVDLVGTYEFGSARAAC